MATRDLFDATMINLLPAVPGAYKEAFVPSSQTAAGMPQDPNMPPVAPFDPQAAQQAGGDPAAAAAAGGMPPDMDPAAMGMAPPGGMPPGMDPATGGAMPPGMPAGMPPGDPAAAGMAPPGPDPAIVAAVQEAMKAYFPGGPPGGASGGDAGGKPKAGGKGGFDATAIHAELYQIKTLLTAFFETAGIPIPPAALDNPAHRPPAAEPAAADSKPGEQKAAGDPLAVGRVAPVKAAQPSDRLPEPPAARRVDPTAPDWVLGLVAARNGQAV